MAEEFSLDDVPGDVLNAANSIMESAPGISQHAIDAHNREREETAADESANVDSAGTPFDPKIHTGSKLKNGTWRTRKNAQAAGSSKVVKPRGKNSSTPDAAAAEAAAAKNAAEAKAAGIMAATAMFSLGRAFGGDEWKPDDAAEFTFQSEAWGNYFLAKGVYDVPPGLALCIAIGGYVGPRLTRPKTSQKVAGIKKWVALRVVRWKLTRALKREGIQATVTIKDGDIFINGTRSDLWNNGERQNFSGEKAR